MTGSDEYAGLFGYIGSGGTVKNVKLENVQITSDYQYAYVGGVAGNNDGAIENCSVSGSVSGNSTYNSVGGVVGYQLGGSITGCSSSATVQGTGSVGGVVGQTNSGATLTACYHATGTVSGPDGATGGVTGRNFNASVGIPVITACYWQNDQAQGIGDNQAGTGETTLVEGSTTWETAMNAMNAELSGTSWKYVSGSGNEPLTLQKQ